METTIRSIRIIIMLIVASFTVLPSSPEAVTFETRFGTPKEDCLMEVVQSRDGSYAVAGYTWHTATPIDTVYGYLAKIDTNGDTLWTRTFDASTWQFFFSLAEMDDSSLVAAGQYTGATGARAYVVRMDAQGDTIWTKQVATDSTSRIEQVRIGSDGSILVAGMMRDAIAPSSQYDVFLIRLDENGDTLSVDLFGGTGDDMCSDVIELSTGGYVIVGVTTPFIPARMRSGERPVDLHQRRLMQSPLFDENDAFGRIYLLDSDRALVWEDTIPNAAYTKWGLVENGDYDVILTGAVNTAPLNADIFLARIDASSGGGVEWMRTLAWPEDDDSRAIAKYSDDLFLITSNTLSLKPAGAYDAYVSLVDIHGDTLYTRLYGYEEWEDFSSICLTDDGEFVAAGGTVSRGAGSCDAYVIKDTVPPLTAFTATPTVGDTPLTVQFTDISTFTATAWEWDFDNDGSVDSYEQNPSYEYTEPGIYTVKLVAGDGDSTYTHIKSDFISVGDTISFNAVPTQGCNPLTVYFHDQSGDDPTAWEWDFENDGAVDSYEPHPIHTYDSVGVYTVKLVVWYGGESDTLIRNDYITVDPNTVIVKPDGTGDYPTIADAVNNAYKGWIIELADGTFTGGDNYEVQIAGDISLTIRSQSDDPQSCIIDCENATHAFNIYESDGFTPHVVIQGITIRNGSVPDVGGGIRYWTATGAVINCRFEDNYALYSGAGIYCNECTPLIQDCVFTGNEVENTGGAVFIQSAHITGSTVAISGCEFSDNIAVKGGGIYIYDSDGTVTGSTFSGNNVTEYGGGVMGCMNSDVALIDCRITGNSVGDDGGGIYFSGDNLHLTDCLIANNYATHHGGGCYIGCDSLVISGCTIAADSVGTAFAGGMELHNTQYITIDRTLIVFNGARAINGGIAPVLSCCDIYGNEDGDWMEPIADQLGTNGNVSVDPLFCDLSSDIYTLQDISPCLPWRNPSCGLIGADSVGCDVAEFLAEPPGGMAPLTAQFTDCTAGSPDAWAWDFQNDGVVDSTSQHPSFEYLASGKYSVSLRAYQGGELIASTVKHDVIELFEGNNVVILPLEIHTEDTTALPIVYYGTEPVGAFAFYFDYDDTRIEYAGYDMYVSRGTSSGAASEDQITVQWYDDTGGDEPIVPGVDSDTLFTILLTPLIYNDTTYVSFDVDQCALGDSTGDPIPDVNWADEPPYGRVILDIGAYITGDVAYYWLGTPVEGALLSMGPPNPDVLTDETGHYQFDRYPFGSYILNIGKTDDCGGISALDAYKVVRHSTGVEPFGNTYKEMAADVNEDDQIDALDAMKIVRVAVGKATVMPSGDWAFDPDSVQIVDLITDRTEDFVAVRMGDVNGDWAPDVGAAPPAIALQEHSLGECGIARLPGRGMLSSANQTITVAMPADTIDASTDSISVPLSVEEFDHIGAMSFRITFDDSVLSYDRMHSGCSDNFVSNLVRNEIRIEWYDATGGSDPMVLGDGTLLTLHFHVLEVEKTSPLDFAGRCAVADTIGDPIADVAFIDGSVTVRSGSGIDDDPVVPKAFKLHNCRPNPFNPSTRILFDIPPGGESTVRTRLRIYNVAGRLIRTLVNERRGAGRYDVLWDGRNDAGADVASGVYFYRLEAERFVDAKKMVLIR